jgi:predicted enzyme related to lactoylglutathione lyase
VTVDDVDAVAAKVKAGGGNVLVPPTDVPQVGRFCVFADPQGAVISAITYVAAPK